MEDAAHAVVRAERALAPLGPVMSRAMFGGWGVYVGDAMIGIVDDGILYLKVDDLCREEYASRGLPPFTARMRGRETEMSFHRAPEPIDDWESLAPFARASLAAAERAAAARRARPPRHRPRPPHV